jgi:hypothetical protein
MLGKQKTASFIIIPREYRDNREKPNIVLVSKEEGNIQYMAKYE